MFQLYSGILRIGGQIAQEILKHDIPAPEVVILRAVHGTDAFVRARKVGVMPRETSAIDLRLRLEEIYGDKVVAAMFGANQSAPMPRDVPDLPMDTGGIDPAVDLETLRAQIRAEVEAELLAEKQAALAGGGGDDDGDPPAELPAAIFATPEPAPTGKKKGKGDPNDVTAILAA